MCGRDPALAGLRRDRPPAPQWGRKRARAGQVPPLQVLQVAGEAAGLEELACTCEIVVAAAQHRRPLELEPAAEVFEDGDGGGEALSGGILIAADDVQLTADAGIDFRWQTCE